MKPSKRTNWKCWENWRSFWRPLDVEGKLFWNILKTLGQVVEDIKIAVIIAERSMYENILLMEAYKVSTLRRIVLNCWFDVLFSTESWTRRANHPDPTPHPRHRSKKKMMKRNTMLEKNASNSSTLSRWQYLSIFLITCPLFYKFQTFHTVLATLQWYQATHSCRIIRTRN